MVLFSWWSLIWGILLEHGRSDNGSNFDLRPEAAAAGALGFIGPGALEAMGDLSGALQDGVEHVREVSAEALKRIQGTKDEAQR